MFYFQLTGGLKVIGIENVPREGPLIIAPNHASYLDPPVIGCSMPRRVAFMAKEELFRSKFLANLILSLGAFPVRRGSSDLESIRIALGILKDGGALLVFPEGTRNLGDTMHPFNRGVEMLARKSGAQILPVGIAGNQRKWGKSGKPGWGKVLVNFGKPIDFQKLSSEEQKRFAELLAVTISALCHGIGYDLKTAPKSQSERADPTNGATSEDSLPESDETQIQP